MKPARWHQLLFIIIFFPVFNVSVYAQPANDNCENALLISDVSNYCSTPGQFTNVNATPSPTPIATCFPITGTSHDVWFQFVAQGNYLNASVNGDTDFNPGGTLDYPQLAVYEGTCDALVQLACISDAVAINSIQTFAGPLNPGQTYYVRVDARNSQEGTFQLCLNNYNQIPEPSGDCFTGVILCDKSPFVVDEVIGEGSDPNELGDSGCNSAFCYLEESSSTWYRWTCDQPGTLTFTLTPLNPVDDIDFILYELPGGIDDCQNKEEIRCMASGENVSMPLADWISCTGPTGLAIGDPDFSETCGCQEGDNNFVNAIDMEAGKSYALIINNFSNSGSGFSVEFGGTGTFLGPEADFEAAPAIACYGESIIFQDLSSFSNGSIEKYTWNFGNGAFPAQAGGPGPHGVIYQSVGLKIISLTIESDQGCIVTTTGTVLVEPCCDDVNSISADVSITPLNCPNDSIGAIDLTPSSNAPPFNFIWDNGNTTEDIGNLASGLYTVTITNAATCTEIFSYEVPGPPPLILQPQMIMPTCDGGMDGSLSLFPAGGNGAPYLYNWGTGFSSANALNNLPVGTYSVTVQDANGCLKDSVLEVTELVLQLDPNVQNVIEPSCFGFSDGSLLIAIANGQPPYQYDFNNGDGFGPSNLLTGIPAGNYTVDVLDANNCKGTFELSIGQPLPLSLAIDTVNVSCFGFADGSATVVVNGGVGNYQYNWTNGETTAMIGPLETGNYFLTVNDANGCSIEGGVAITEPPQLVAAIDSLADVLCFGDNTGIVVLLASGGSPPYQYSANGQFFQNTALLRNLFAGSFNFIVQDANGCTDTVGGIIEEPLPLSIDAGPDQTIDLGSSTTLPTFLTPYFRTVTYSWQPPDSLSCQDCGRPTANPTETTTYTVTVRDSNDCTAADEVTVFVKKERPIYFPNVFSPNGDGINDYFTIFGNEAIRRLRFVRIYSRWGSLVYEGKNLTPGVEKEGWDGRFRGKPMSPGVFAFVAEVEFVDGLIVLYKGDVTLVD